jgi:hypothetical protein
MRDIITVSSDSDSEDPAAVWKNLGTSDGNEKNRIPLGVSSNTDSPGFKGIHFFDAFHLL